VRSDTFAQSLRDRGSYFPNFAGHVAHGSHRLYHHLPSAGDFLLESFNLTPGFVFQGQQPDVDGYEGLRDFILKLPADFLAFSLLCCQQPMGKLPQTLLQLERFCQTFTVQLRALFEGNFHNLAPDQAALNSSFGGGEFFRARCQHSLNVPQMSSGVLGDGGLGHDGLRRYYAACWNAPWFSKGKAMPGNMRRTR
jgi:hypothetical protein